jgi:hypothetical protein
MAIITNLQPPAGEPISADTAISFDVIDPVIAELRVFVWAVFQETGQVELANDADNFQPLYSFSTIENIPGGRRYTIQRVGGWPNAPELRVDSCACPPELVPPSTGEINTASNVPGGVGIFQTKAGVDLRFKSLRSSDGSITITGEPNTVDLVANVAAARWDETLVAGPNSNGSDAYLTREDTLYLSDTASPLGDPTIPPPLGAIGADFVDPNFGGRTSRATRLTGVSFLTFANIGSAVYTYDAANSGAGNLIWVRWVGGYKTVGPSAVSYDMVVLEEIWELSFGTWSKVATLTKSELGETFRFQGSGQSLFLQCLGNGVEANPRAVRGMVEFVTIDGPLAS